MITKLWICCMTQQADITSLCKTLTPKSSLFISYPSLSVFCPQITHTALQERSWRASSKASLDVAVTFCQISLTTVFTLCSGSWTDSQVRARAWKSSIFHYLLPPLSPYLSLSLFEMRSDEFSVKRCEQILNFGLLLHFCLLSFKFVIDHGETCGRTVYLFKGPVCRI